MWFTGILSVLGKGVGLISGINFGAIVPALQSVGQNILKYWQYWLIALLLGVNGFTGYELKHTQDKLKLEVAAHVKDITDFKTAQAQADQNVVATKAALTKESQADADQADANYSSLLSKYRSSLLRFSANQSGTGASSGGQLSTAQGGDGPSASTDLPKSITISGDDAGVCAVNTARLQAVHDWAVNLPKEPK